MITRPAASGSGLPPGNQIKSKSGKFDLKSEDFIRMMITQLQHQDPMEPAKNDQLLAQMSQIGQLQASTTLQESLKGLVIQNQIGSAGNLIGKSVQGLDDKNEAVRGVVNSVKVEGEEVFLELDNGKRLALARVTGIAGAPAPAKAVAT
jgi:flagellar basal-body rod modification protein FlgD